MAEAYSIASKNAAKFADQDKIQYDKRTRGPALRVGSHVLVRNVAEKGGPGNIRSYLEDHIYVVKCQMGEDSPVFEVEAENDKGRTRVLHRKMLLPCDFLPLQSDGNMTATKTKKRHDIKRGQTRVEHTQNLGSEEEVADEFSYYSLGIHLHWTPWLQNLCHKWTVA